MTHNRHIRGWLMAALLFSAAFSAYEAPPPASAPRAIAVPTAIMGSSIPSRPIIGAAEKPRPFEGFVLSQALRDSIVAIALLQLGAPYVFGGASPRKGFDCSGLVRYAMSQVHMSVPRTALQQSRLGASIERRQLQRGDLIAFGDGPEVTHIGIYVGAGRFVHASSAAGKVILSPLDRPPSRLIRPMKGARRLLATSDAPTRRAGS
jgi:hypothetical protein